MFVTGKKIPIEKTTYLHTLSVVFSNFRILRAAARTVYTIVRDFFLMQSPLRPKRKRQPVVWIDHPYDRNIPFAPEWVTEYLSFIPLWVTGITWLVVRFGRRGIQPLIDSLNEVSLLYRSAATVYRACQSTTVRPSPARNSFRFALIHATDPHLNCLPSLHVMVVTWAGYRLARRILDLDSSQSAAVEYIRTHAKLITETTLYVKQHSVNCIPAALFVMMELFPGIDTLYGEDFINSLFNDTVPGIEDRQAVTSYMAELYRTFLGARAGGNFASFDRVLLDFLKRYTLESPSDEILPNGESA
ncbi:MAG: hypothetical protein ACOC2H_01160 [Spirochaetota bacterium]